jgi:hypothetical protein
MEALGFCSPGNATSAAPKPAVQVSIDPPQVVIGGNAIALRSDVEAHFVKAVAEADSWISGPELQSSNPIFDGVRLDRLAKGLPSPVRELIEAKSPKGYRWKAQRKV